MIKKNKNKIKKGILKPKNITINEIAKINDIYNQIKTIRSELAYNNHKLKDLYILRNLNIAQINYSLNLISTIFQLLALYHKTLIRYSNYIIKKNIKKNDIKKLKLSDKYFSSKKINFNFYINEFFIYLLKSIEITSLIYTYDINYKIGIKFIDLGWNLIKEIKITMNPNIINNIIKILLVKQKFLLSSLKFEESINIGKEIIKYFRIEFSIRKNENLNFNKPKKIQNLFILININLINMSYSFEERNEFENALDYLKLANDLNYFIDLKKKNLNHYLASKIKKLNFIVNNLIGQKNYLIEHIINYYKENYNYEEQIIGNFEIKKTNKNFNINKLIILKDKEYIIPRKRKKLNSIENWDKNKTLVEKNLSIFKNKHRTNLSIDNKFTKKNIIEDKNKYINNLEYNPYKFTGLGRLKTKKNLIIHKSIDPDIYSYINEKKQKHGLKQLEYKEPYEIDNYFKKRLENYDPNLKNIKNFNEIVKEIYYIDNLKLKEGIKNKKNRSKLKIKKNFLKQYNKSEDNLKIIGFNDQRKKNFKSFNHLLKINDNEFNKNFENEKNVIKIFNLKKYFDDQKLKYKTKKNKKSYKSFSIFKKTFNYDSFAETPNYHKLQSIIFKNKNKIKLDNIISLKEKNKTKCEESFKLPKYKEITKDQKAQFDFVKDQIQSEMDKLENKIWNKKDIKTYKDMIKLKKRENLEKKQEKEIILKEETIVSTQKDLYKSLKNFSIYKIMDKKIWGLDKIVLLKKKILEKNINI